ncbi:MAG TPA: response regulator [Gemmatimonadales bacterium]|nr:response regulator [Gemmatimonadales bacterium]
MCDDPELSEELIRAGAARGWVVESYCTAAAARRRLEERPFAPGSGADVIPFPTPALRPAAPVRRPAATQCLAFQDGEKAMAWLMNGEAPRDALIVLDLDLPGIDTQDAVRRLAEADGHRHRVLATTASRNVAVQLGALRAGAVDCLVKPLSFPLFAARVERLLATP